jgi:tripartite-type tricarboxylate transporter receptor subunit TctC
LQIERGEIMKAIRLTGLMLAALYAAGGTAKAQEFPSRPITMVMPYAAGGPGDTLARLLAQGMSVPLKQQVIVENASGAGGSIGSAKVAGSAPDGYNLLLIHISHATNPALYPNLRYDPVKDYEPIGLAVELPSAFVARKAIPASTFPELIAYVKANLATVTYAHAGIGSASHLCGLLFESAAGIKMTQVAYRGTGPAMNDLMGGQVDFICDQIVNVVGQVEGGTLKGFAVTGNEPSPALPNLPVASDFGLPNFTYKVWYGLFAPKGTPKPVVDRLVGALNSALQDRNVRDRLAQLGAEAVSSERAQPAMLAAHLKAEIEKWTPIIKAAGVMGAR